jgi:uncharacterized paraquat-inducible protein A
MFRLTLHEMIFAYTGGCLLVIFLAAWAYNFGRTRREHAARKGLMRCRLCAFEFRNSENAVLPRCPRCNSLVERRRLSKL